MPTGAAPGAATERRIEPGAAAAPGPGPLAAIVLHDRAQDPDRLVGHEIAG